MFQRTELGGQFEIDLRHALARQAAAHSDHLREVLKVQVSVTFQHLLEM